jgi:hypothetical protein
MFPAPPVYLLLDFQHFVKNEPGAVYRFLNLRRLLCVWIDPHAKTMLLNQTITSVPCHCRVALNNAVSTPRLSKPLPFDTIQNNAIPSLFLAVQFRGIAYRSMPCRSRSSPSPAMPLPCNSEAILGESPLWPCITLHP